MPTTVPDAPLKISLSNVSDVRLAQLTRELERDLSHAGFRSQFIELSPIPGDRGEPVTLGVLTLRSSPMGR